MKGYIFIFFLLVSSAICAQGINDLGFGFQAYARNVDGSAVSNQTVRVKFSIYPTDNAANIAFEEEHSVNTDAYGIFVAEVGSINTGGFMSLDFVNVKYGLKVEISVQGSNLIEISNKPLNAVPYARASAYADNSNTATSALNGVPSGTILPFAGENIPAGFVACDGASYSKTDPTYQALANALNGAWGESGNNFNVPDLRGLFLRGVGGDDIVNPDRIARESRNGGFSGDRVGSFQADATGKNGLTARNDGPAKTDVDGEHSHTYDAPRDKRGNPDGALDVDGSSNARSYWRGRASSQISTPLGGAHSHTVNLNLLVESSDNETRPANAAVLYIIKL